MSDKPERQWNEALALQTIVRDLEVQALTCYMTDPRKFGAITRHIGQLINLLEPEKPNAGESCRVPCMTGYHCCCGRCVPDGRLCPLCKGLSDMGTSEPCRV